MLNILLNEPSGQGHWILFLGMFIIMYFFMIRPQMKRQREAKEFREAISKGDKVVTIGGVHGKIISFSLTTLINNSIVFINLSLLSTI